MTNTSIAYTKQSAAAEQIEVAMKCFFENKYASAITLACAAEGMMPETEALTLYSSLKDQASNFGIQNTNDLVNQMRDWLKHRTDAKPSTVKIEQAKVAYDILRGLTKYYAVYCSQTDAMNKFEEYIRDNYYLGAP